MQGYKGFTFTPAKQKEPPKTYQVLVRDGYVAGFAETGGFEDGLQVTEDVYSQLKKISSEELAAYKYVQKSGSLKLDKNRLAQLKPEHEGGPQ